MYIGPWQEYRLAKLQKHALEKIRAEGGAHICSQLATQQLVSPTCTVASDETASSGSSAKLMEVALDLEMQERIRTLMEPFLAKLPARLLGKGRKPSSTRSMDQNTSRSTARRSKPSKPIDTPQKEGGKKTMILKKQASLPLTKQKKKRNSGAISAVDKRKRLYAKWMKPAESPKKDSNQEKGEGNIIKTIQDTKLPSLQIPLQSVVSECTSPSFSAEFRLPQLIRSPSITPSSQYQQSTKVEPACKSQDQGSRSNLFDHLDEHDEDHESLVSEEEINAFLNWTDCLASPSQLDREIALME